jgi:glycosyltransferase involved in cell wall biosynthesis
MIDVIIPAHNPNRARLERVLDALAAQTLSLDEWSVTLVDNASTPPIDVDPRGVHLAIAPEPTLGLAWARRRGAEAGVGDVLVFVDDDNLLDPDYLAYVREIAAAHPELGAFGGRVAPEWESGRAPPEWVAEFGDILALRDLGDEVIVQHPGEFRGYPTAAPVGAGMAIRRTALQPWLAAARAGKVASDRRGASLASGGDNEMVILAVRDGFSVGYYPQLRLRHVMPEQRLEKAYLGRLKYGVERSWVKLLDDYGLSPWGPALPAAAPIRKARAFVRHAAWTGPAAYVRWRGACGRFDGRGDIWRGRRGG